MAENLDSHLYSKLTVFHRRVQTFGHENKTFHYSVTSFHPMKFENLQFHSLQLQPLTNSIY